MKSTVEGINHGGFNETPWPKQHLLSLKYYQSNYEKLKSCFYTSKGPSRMHNRQLMRPFYVHLIYSFHKEIEFPAFCE